MLLVHTEAWVGATCLNGGVSAMRVKVILQKWFNRAISYIRGRNTAPVINSNQFIAHRWLPLFYFQFCNQIKVKEAKDKRRRGKEARRGERQQERGSRTRNGLEQNQALTLGLEGWAFLVQKNREENGLVFWACRNWEGCSGIFLLVYNDVLVLFLNTKWFHGQCLWMYCFCKRCWTEALVDFWCAKEQLQRPGFQKEGYPKAIFEYAVTRFCCSVLVWDQWNTLFIWFMLENKQSGCSDASWGRSVFFQWRECFNFFLCTLRNFILNPNGP